MQEDEKPQPPIFTLPSDSIELRSFFRVEGHTNEVQAVEVWQYGLLWLGDPVTHLALRILLPGELAEGDIQALTFSFDISQARALHKALGELLNLLDSSDTP